MKKFIASLSCLLFFSNYALAQVYLNLNNPNANYDLDRQACTNSAKDVVRESSHALINFAAAIVNGISGSVDIAKCMDSKGWVYASKEDEQKWKDAQKAVQDIEKVNDRLIKHAAALEELNNDPQYKFCSLNELRPFYLKSACKAQDISLSQLTDQSKATPAEKLSIDFLDKRAKEYLEKRALIFEKGPDKNSGPALARLDRETSKSASESRLNLYMGKITWGQYNQIRKTDWEKFDADFEKILAMPPSY